MDYKLVLNVLGTVIFAALLGLTMLQSRAQARAPTSGSGSGSGSGRRWSCE